MSISIEHNLWVDQSNDNDFLARLVCETSINQGNSFVFEPNEEWTLLTLDASDETQHKMHVSFKRSVVVSLPNWKRFVERFKFNSTSTPKSIARIVFKVHREKFRNKGPLISLRLQTVNGQVELVIGRLNTVMDLKALVHEIFHIKPNLQHLTYGGVPLLFPDETLESYGLRSGCEIKSQILTYGGSAIDLVKRKPYRFAGRLEQGEMTTQKDEIVSFEDDIDFGITEFMIEFHHRSYPTLQNTRDVNL